MNRRKFIAGLLASAAVPAAVAKAAREPCNWFGIVGPEPAVKREFVVSWSGDLVAGHSLANARRDVQWAVQTFVYGSDNVPNQFAGFTPEWSAT